MDVKFSRSFFGYDPEEVEHRIKIYNKKFEDKMRELTDQLFEVNRETEVLRERIRLIQKELDEHEMIKEGIKETLFINHVQATKEVYTAIEEGKAINRKTREEVASREKKKEEMKKMMESLMREMDSITQSYNKSLEACKKWLNQQV